MNPWELAEAKSWHVGTLNVGKLKEERRMLVEAEEYKRREAGLYMHTDRHRLCGRTASGDG